MSTLTPNNVFSSALSLSFESADFVSLDNAALASHMNRCASTRSRFFGLHALLESAHALVCSRMVTAAMIALMLLAVAATV
jgi:hypothetical protein